MFSTNLVTGSVFFSSPGCVLWSCTEVIGVKSEWIVYRAQDFDTGGWGLHPVSCVCLGFRLLKHKVMAREPLRFCHPT